MNEAQASKLRNIEEGYLEWFGEGIDTDTLFALLSKKKEEILESFAKSFLSGLDGKDVMELKRHTELAHEQEYKRNQIVEDGKNGQSEAPSEIVGTRRRGRKPASSSQEG